MCSGFPKSHKEGSGSQTGDFGPNAAHRIGEVLFRGVLHCRGYAQNFPISTACCSWRRGGQPNGGSRAVSLFNPPGYGFLGRGAIQPLITGLQRSNSCIATYIGSPVSSQCISSAFLYANLLCSSPFQAGFCQRNRDADGSGGCLSNR